MKEYYELNLFTVFSVMLIHKRSFRNITGKIIILLERTLKVLNVNIAEDEGKTVS